MAQPKRLHGRDDETRQDWVYDTHTGILTIGCQQHTPADWRSSPAVDQVVREFAGLIDTCTNDNCQTCAVAPDAYARYRARLNGILDLVDAITQQRVQTAS